MIIKKFHKSEKWEESISIEEWFTWRVWQVVISYFTIPFFFPFNRVDKSYLYCLIITFDIQAPIINPASSLRAINTCLPQPISLSPVQQAAHSPEHFNYLGLKSYMSKLDKKLCSLSFLDYHMSSSTLVEPMAPPSMKRYSNAKPQSFQINRISYHCLLK